MNSHDNKVTLVASGSEVELALSVHALLKRIMLSRKSSRCLAKNYLIISQMDYKNDIFDEDSLIVTIEAGNVSSWKKYLGKKGISFGLIDLVKALLIKKFTNILICLQKK